MKGLDSVIGNILFDAPKVESVETKFTTLVQTHSFLKKNELISSMFYQVRDKRKISEKQKAIMRNLIRQWDDKTVQRYIKFCNKYPFLKQVDRVNAYAALINGSVLLDRQLGWVETFLREFKTIKEWRQYLTGDVITDLRVYQVLVENKLIPENEFAYMINRVDPKLAKYLKFKRGVLVEYQTKYKNSENAFHKQMVVFLKKQFPLTSKQWDALVRNVDAEKVREKSTKKNFVYTQQLKRVRSI